MRLLLIFLALSFSAMASYGVSETLIHRIATEEKVPVKLLRSIARLESGYRGQIWPWTLNVEGKPWYFPTRQDAEKFLEQQLSEGISNIDIGCTQVNWAWHGAHFARARDLLRPEIGLRYAATLLKAHVRESRSWLKAALLYHSREAEHQRTYRVRLLEELRQGSGL